MHRTSRDLSVGPVSPPRVAAGSLGGTEAEDRQQEAQALRGHCDQRASARQRRQPRASSRVARAQAAVTTLRPLTRAVPVFRRRGTPQRGSAPGSQGSHQVPSQSPCPPTAPSHRRPTGALPGPAFPQLLLQQMPFQISPTVHRPDLSVTLIIFHKRPCI